MSDLEDVYQTLKMQDFERSNVKPSQSLSHLINKFRASKRDNSIYLITREMFGVEEANHLAKSFNWEVSEDLYN